MNLLDACVTGTSYRDANVASATTYYYVVRAEDGTASAGGACNGGNVDGNTVEKSGGAGLTPTTLYSNGFEGLDDFSHGVDVSGKADSWRGIQTNCPAASGSGTYRFGGGSCSANYAFDNFASAGPSAAISVPPGAANVRMSFAHRFQLERDGAGVYDGGYVAASVDGSPFQPVAPSRLSGAGYNVVIDGPCSNAVGAPVFSDTSAGYAGGSFLTTSVHLDGVCDDVTGGAGGCAGHDVRFRFVAVSDCAVNLDGWFIDDVSIDADLAGSCSPTPDPLPFFTVTSTEARNTLQWLNPASGGDVTVVFRTDRFPNAADDGTVLTPPLGTPGAPQSFLHEPLPNGTTHYYAAFVGNHHLYQVLTVPFRAGSGAPHEPEGQKRKLADYPLPMKEIEAQRVGSGRTRRITVSALLPVAGTSISSSSLYTTEPHLLDFWARKSSPQRRRVSRRFLSQVAFPLLSRESRD
jgi:hypothetical protein